MAEREVVALNEDTPQLEAAQVADTYLFPRSIRINGGITRKVTTVAAATYDLLITDDIVHVAYTTTAAVTSFTLPTAQAIAGRTISIKDADGNASVNNITIDTEGAETIDGAATLVMATDDQAVTLYSDGTNWFTL